MKKTYDKPTIKVRNLRTKNMICTSLGGEADPNKATLSKETSFYWDDEDSE